MWAGCSHPIPPASNASHPTCCETPTWWSSTGCSRSWPSLSLLLPLGIGWAVTGTLGGALGVFLWAGLIRMALLHHVTWSINSVCHLWGRRPFTTGDHSANVASLALVSFGESWHNFHHAAPASARHGVLEHQVDLAAGLIRIFERAGWVTKVRWPTAIQIDTLTTRVEEPLSA